MSFGQDASFRLEQPVGSMSISPCGRDVVLASREGLHIIDLDSPYSPPRYLPHHTSWEVADVQWSPFASRDYWVVSTSNQKALVWNLARSGQDAIEHVLHAHTRAITDINFSAHHADVLATCGVDSFVHCWDLRSPSRPAFSFSDWFAGATQVKWSRQDPHVLASSHDKFLRIWDERKGAYPLHTIEAHDTKIYGIDWNRFEVSKLVTCSLDRTIKFWNLNSLEAGPQHVLKTPFPVWRARHTPFGWALLAMPQRSSNDLYLYDRRSLSHTSKPVKIFPGHKGQVKEFLWRAQGTIQDGIDHRDFQLVSWGVDRELKLHKVEADVLYDIGYEKGVTKARRLNFTRRGATYKTFRDEPREDRPPTNATHQRNISSLSGSQHHLRPRGSQSVGMSKISLPQFRGWAQGRREDTRMGMHGRARVRETLSPITWMKNVRIHTWESEGLADEITQVGDRFKKVEFDSVDVNHGRATVSLHGPWGEKNAAIYIRVEMRFPKLYPHNAHAKFSVQKTALMTDSLMDTLSTDLQTIAETYARRRKGCIEAVLRYLLRDQTLEQAISLVLDEDFLDTKAFPTTDLPDDVSSSDDDEQIQAPADVLDASNANVRVPLAKACGALWSDSGKLVCFFPPKTEQPSMMDSLELRDQDRLRSVKVFEGFGRLQTSSPGPKNTLGTKTTDDESLSDSSDSSLSSTSSSQSSEVRPVTQSGFLPRRPWHRGVGFLKRALSTELSNRSTNGLGAEVAIESTKANIVSIHDFSDLIPSKPELAMGYRIFGNGPDVCDHNAEIASQESKHAVASVWRLAKLILQSNVPLTLVREPISAKSILTVAKSAVPDLVRKDSAVDLSSDIGNEEHSSGIAGRVRWGNSPLGPSYLIPALFDHFESLGDVQMLAMLSCVFAEPRSSQPESLLVPHKDQDLSIELKAPAFSVDYYPSTDVARSSVSLSAIKLSNSISPSKTGDSSELDSSMAAHADESRSRTDTLADVNGMAIHHSRRSSAATGVLARDIRTAGSSAAQSAAVSLSTSPEENRLIRVSSSGQGFPFSKASLSALHQSYSSSPPTTVSLVDSNKVNSSSGGLTTGGWSANTLFGGAIASRNSRTSLQASTASSDEQKTGLLLPSSSFSNLRSAHRDSSHIQETRKASVNSLRPPSKRSIAAGSGSRNRKNAKVRTSLYNQSNFDLDGYASMPLFDPNREQRYRGYRASYAHLLGVWGLYPQMAEVLKFDGLAGYFTAENNGRDWHLSNARRRKTLSEAADVVLQDKKGLEVRRCCHDCGNPLAPIEKNNVPIAWHCTMPRCPSSTSTSSRRETCTVCNRFIRGLMVPCLECGHVTCAECAEGWFRSFGARRKIDQEGETDASGGQCPSGCGCACPSLEKINVNSIGGKGPGLQIEIPSTSQERQLAQRSERLMSTHGPDTAIGAFLSLTRTRSISAARESMLRVRSREDLAAIEDSPVTPSAEDELNGWSSSKFAGLGRGYGGGLSRGLSTKSSDATIRKADGK